MAHVDLRPTTAALADLVRGVRDDQLGDPTPCPAYSVGDLVDHIGGLAVAFTSAARKDSREGHAPSADGARLEDGFRDRIAAALTELGEAWQDRAAYGGTTMAGPVELPAVQAALVALDEVTVHAWDLAVATGQPYPADPVAVDACRAFVASFEPPARRRR
ncbi:TIGR03086 family metal-binding protein [Nocardioides anomalus]|uniref:TIGR03086 family metal-binding protein n=1 Tax=Nocardioides anomalus TaxID=2712223 RepID=UPI001E4DA1C8|nr:TIGR03086 family metal-binding protein [Nocardioides anomalus]